MLPGSFQAIEHPQYSDAQLQKGEPRFSETMVNTNGGHKTVQGELFEIK
jgi:hypothetical protein